MKCTNLSDVDLLKKLVGPRTSKKLYRGSLRELLTSSECAHDTLVAAREIVKRSLMEEMKTWDVLSSPNAVRDYLRLRLSSLEHESFLVICLDAQNRVLEAEELFRGTLTQTSVYPREIVKYALRRNAAAVIFAHNHPSGVAEPSRADEALTATLKQARLRSLT